MILIAVGSNLPVSGLDSQQIVLRSISTIECIAQVVARSRIFSSPAWPNRQDPEYSNAVIAIETNIPPTNLLAALLAIEAAFGRVRWRLSNAPRTLDLDLLSYNDVIFNSARTGLVLPHPRMETREFVLAPLCDVAPDWRHPVTGQSASALYAAVKTGETRPVREEK